MNLSNFLLSLTIGIIITSQLSCAYENEEDLYNIGVEPIDSCGITVVSYSSDIVPILDVSCNNACHNENTRFGNVILDSYDNVNTFVLNGKLLGTIKHEDGFSPMPQGGKLENCEINLVEKWVEEGALNN